MACKLPRSGSSFQAATFAVTLGAINSKPLLILSPMSSVKISSVQLLNTSGFEMLIKGTGFGTEAPPAFFTSAQVRFDNVATRQCTALNWTSDSSINCAYAGIPQDSANNAATINVDFLISGAVKATGSTPNPDFVPSQKTLRTGLVFRFYSPRVYSPFTSSPLLSNSIAFSFMNNSYYSNQLIELSFVIIYNNSQPYVTSSASGYSDLQIDYLNSVATNGSNVSTIASVMSSSSNGFGDHLQRRPQKIGIPAGNNTFTYNLNLALALSANVEYSSARLSFNIVLPDGLIPCESPSFSLRSLPQSATTLQRIRILNTNVTDARFIANQSLAPSVVFQVDLPTQFPLNCAELMFNYDASLICSVLGSDRLLAANRYVVEKSCVFSPSFNTALPLSKLCRIRLDRISLSDADSGFDSSGNLTQVNFSTTFGPVAKVVLIGAVPQSLKGGSVIASNNGTQGACLEVQLYDNHGNRYEQSGIAGTLSASSFNKSYDLLGNITTMSSDTGTFLWCGVMSSKLASNVSFHVQFSEFNVMISGPHNVNSSGDVASVMLAAPMPTNVSLQPGGTLPPVTMSLVDLGGNAFEFKASTFVRVRVFSKRPKSGARRLLVDGDLVEETTSTCPEGGAAQVAVSSSANITINASTFACTAGDSVIVYDIISITNGTVTVISGNMPLLSLPIVVLPGPAATFYLSNAKTVASLAFTRLVNVTAVTFKDIGLNVNCPAPIIELSLC